MWRRRSRVQHDHGAASGVAGEAAMFGNHTRMEAQRVRSDYLHDEAMLGPGAQEEAAILRCRSGKAGKNAFGGASVQNTSIWPHSEGHFWPMCLVNC